MVNRLKNNISIKIFSIIAALLLWFYVQMVQNPEIEFTFDNLSVNLVNANIMEENGYILPEKFEEKVDISVKCQRWKLNELDAEDFVVYVDLADIKTSGQITLPVKVRLNNENITITNKNPANVTLAVDQLITIEKPIEVHFSGTLNETKYVVDSMVTTDPKVATIKGPKSILNKINNAVVNVELDGKDDSFNEIGKVILVDSEGEAIKSNNITLLTEQTKIGVNIYDKKILPISVIFREATDVKYEIKPSSIEVAAPKNIAANLSDIIINDFKLESEVKGYEQAIKISLPKDVIILTEENPRVVVTE